MATLSVDGTLEQKTVALLPPKRLKTVRELILEKRQNSENSKPIKTGNVIHDDKGLLTNTKCLFISQLLCPKVGDPMADETSKSDSQVSLLLDDSKHSSNNGQQKCSACPVRRKRRKKRLPSDEVDPSTFEEIMKKYPAIAPKGSEQEARDAPKNVPNEDLVGTVLQSKENMPQAAEIREPRKIVDTQAKSLKSTISNLKLKDLSLEEISKLTLDDILRLGILEMVNESEIAGIISQMEEALSQINLVRCRHTLLGSRLRDFEDGNSSANEGSSSSVSCDNGLEADDVTTCVNDKNEASFETVDVEKEQYMDYLLLKPNINNVIRRQRPKYNKYMEILNGRYKEYMRNPSIPLSRIRNFYWYLKWQANKNKAIPAGSELRNSEGNSFYLLFALCPILMDDPRISMVTWLIKYY